MNGSLASAMELARAVEASVASEPGLLSRCDFLVCPPFVHVGGVKPVLTHVSLGAQDCSVFTNGAYTGDVSADMLADMGCTHVILGHSERRQHFGETDGAIRQKAEKVWQAGMTALICVGETEAQREEGQEAHIVAEQMKHAIPDGATSRNVVVAYEPVWAIGTGKTATPDDIRTMHAFIKDQLSARFGDQPIRILYGGSVKPSNAGDIFNIPHVHGALIGGASLKSSDFIGIAKEVKELD